MGAPTRIARSWGGWSSMRDRMGRPVRESGPAGIAGPAIYGIESSRPTPEYGRVMFPNGVTTVNWPFTV